MFLFAIDEQRVMGCRFLVGFFFAKDDSAAAYGRRGHRSWWWGAVAKTLKWMDSMSSPGIMNRVFSRVRNLDAYPKVNEDFYSRTLSGGVITLASSVAMIFLVFSRLQYYRLA